MLSLDTCVRKKTKEIYAEVFNMITNKNETKPMTKHISCDRKWKKDYSWNPSACTCENSKYLKIVIDTSVITCDEIKSVTDIITTKITNAIAINVKSTSSIHYHSKKVRGCHVLHTVL